METSQEKSDRAVVATETFDLDGDIASELFDEMKLVGINRLHVDTDIVSTVYGDDCETDVILNRVQVEYCEGHAETFSNDAGGRTVASTDHTELTEVKDCLEAVLQYGLGGLDGVCNVTVDPWAKTIDGRGASHSIGRRMDTMNKIDELIDRYCVAQHLSPAIRRERHLDAGTDRRAVGTGAHR